MPVRVERRAFALLCHLVEHRNRVVPGEELVAAAWSGEPATNAALATALRAVRLAIGDDGRRQAFIRTVHRRGYQFVAQAKAVTGAVSTVQAAVAPGPADRAVDDTTAGLRDSIRFCRTADGTRIAWAATGKGPPLVKTANWLSRIDLERTMAFARHWFEGLTEGRQLIRYDERGCGLSDADSGFTMDEWVEDLDAVADAAGHDRFPLLGVSQGGPLAIAYAARRPERVSRLILNAAYVRGRLARARGATENAEAALDLRLSLAGWYGDDRSFQRFFGGQFFAGRPPEQWDEFTTYQKRTATSANGARFLEAQSRMDVADLATQVACPTLITHSCDDPRVPMSEAIELADLIPDSRLVILDGRNHLLTGDEPAWHGFLAEMRAFLAEEN
ncbi:alpha/beta fold hydrolase [Actinoplanes sp. NPDC026619]|uniref:alpha/beta fold hydrolase n=1 Tax=Actinoplanes sp. NPDC026619 TaxID=3155798 RepID=UPI0033CF945E